MNLTYKHAEGNLLVLMNQTWESNHTSLGISLLVHFSKVKFAVIPSFGIKWRVSISTASRWKGTTKQRKIGKTKIHPQQSIFFRTKNHWFVKKYFTIRKQERKERKTNTLLSFYLLTSLWRARQTFSVEFWFFTSEPQTHSVTIQRQQYGFSQIDKKK